MLPVAVPLTALVAALAVCVPAGAAAEIAARTRTARYNAELEAAVHARTAELAETQLEVVVRLAQAAELRDDDTGDHIERMSGLCREVALELGLSAAEADLIRHASVLHDIGKIGVPDGILLKPGRLTDDEMAIMRRHVLDGALLLTGSDSELLQAAEVIVRTHHERWDGTGYPAGSPVRRSRCRAASPPSATSTTRSSTSARTSARGPSAEACAEIERGRGHHFDPQVADALLTVIARREAAAQPATRAASAASVARSASGVAALIDLEVPQQLG